VPKYRDVARLTIAKLLSDADDAEIVSEDDLTMRWSTLQVGSRWHPLIIEFKDRRGSKALEVVEPHTIELVAKLRETLTDATWTDLFEKVASQAAVVSADTSLELLPEAIGDAAIVVVPMRSGYAAVDREDLADRVRRRFLETAPSASYL
jgi:hypothetical protein